MASKAKKPDLDAAEQGQRTRFQGYEAVEIHRSALKNAAYNPRVLTDKAKRKLKTGMEKLRLLEPPTWNVRTGNIVGGHQRMNILDALQGSADYTLTVSKVDLSEIEEREANLLLNNAEAQGDWDLEKLEQILQDTNLDVEATGFDMADVYRMFGDAPVAEREGAMDELAKRIREAREGLDKLYKEGRAADDSEFYVVVVFRDEETRHKFLSELRLDDNRYQDGRELIRLYKNAFVPVPEAVAVPAAPAPAPPPAQESA